MYIVLITNLKSFKMEGMKSCIKCNKVKYVFEFYKHNKMADGYLNKCRDCSKKENAERQAKLLSTPEGLEKERNRHREKYHRLGYKEKHKQSTEQSRKSTIKFRKNYPEKYKAHSSSQRLPCEKGNQLHHWSYNEEHWKDCIELNVADHALLHRYIKYDQERYMYRNLDGVLLDTKQIHIDLLESLKLQGVT